MTAYPKPPYLSVSPDERCQPDMPPPSNSSHKQSSVNILPHHYSSQYLPLSPHLSTYPDYFHKGSVIQLAEGHTKRVEDLVTEDFISSARSNPDVTIDDSTVVKIDPGDMQGWAALTFRVGKESLQVTITAPEEHPFFVFGAGWSSISPSLSMTRYGLSCAKLSLGDVCISLAKTKNPGMQDVRTKDSKETSFKNKTENLVSSLQSAVIPKQLEVTPTSRLHKAELTESTSVTYSLSRPSPSSELSLTVCVAAGGNTESAGNTGRTSEEKNLSDISHS